MGYGCLQENLSHWGVLSCCMVMLADGDRLVVLLGECHRGLPAGETLCISVCISCCFQTSYFGSLPLLLLMKTSAEWRDRVHRELDCKCLDPFTFNSVILLKVPVINKLTSRSRHLQRAVLPTGFLFFPVRKDICCPKNILAQTSWAFGALLCKTLSSVHGFSEHHWASLLLHSACSAVTRPHGNERAAT